MSSCSMRSPFQTLEYAFQGLGCPFQGLEYTFQIMKCTKQPNAWFYATR